MPADAAPAADVLKVALEAPRATMAELARRRRSGAADLPNRAARPRPPLRYELRRGVFRGTGEIRWRPAGDRYALQFDARVAGV